MLTRATGHPIRILVIASGRRNVRRRRVAARVSCVIPLRRRQNLAFSAVRGGAIIPIPLAAKTVASPFLHPRLVLAPNPRRVRAVRERVVKRGVVLAVRKVGHDGAENGAGKDVLPVVWEGEASVSRSRA